MSDGHIEVAHQGSTHILKFTGDVRLNLCTTLERYVEDVLSQKPFTEIIIDVSEAEGLDSTTLGQIAKISIFSRSHYSVTPVIYSPNESITRILLSMGFEQVFDIIQYSFKEPVEFEEWLSECIDDETARKQIISAHEVLISLNDKNKSLFTDLVTTLKKIG